jgi:glutaminyl-peptide cyclotransferase
MTAGIHYNTNMKTQRISTNLKVITLLTMICLCLSIGACHRSPTVTGFSGARALQDVEYQLSLGPRTMGSQAHDQLVDWLVDELDQCGWQTRIQETYWAGEPIRNVIATRGEGKPWIILGAHYDSRFVSDQDPDPARQATPVPGANDGASGVAVLLGLARALPTGLEKQVWLVFFDAEDNGRLQGWDWILGSRAFVQTLTDQPDAVIIVDMVGDADLNLYMEQHSSAELRESIWQLATSLGHVQFIPQTKYSILDDHTPFLQAGIPAVDIIDFDYPYWHTTADTLDKVSAESLEAVGDVLYAWLTR